MKKSIFILCALFVVSFEEIERQQSLSDAMDLIEIVNQVWGWLECADCGVIEIDDGYHVDPNTQYLAPGSEIKRFKQHRFCTICANHIDTTLVERHEKSTVYGICDSCHAKRDQVIKGKRPIELAMPWTPISVVTHCKVCKNVIRVDRMHPNYDKIQWDTCSRCKIKTAGFGIKTIECCRCGKIQAYEPIPKEKDGEYKYIVCNTCKAELDFRYPSYEEMEAKRRAQEAPYLKRIETAI